MKQNKQGEASQKHLGGVKKRLKWSAALVGILIVSLSLSGCKNFVETDVSAETTSISSTVSETAVVTNNEETQFVTEFEITDWTMGDLVTDMEIEGQKFSLPCSASQLNKDYKVNYTGYSLKYDHTVADLYYKKEYISQITVDKNVSDLDFCDKNIIAFFMGGAYPMPQFNVMGITNDSTPDDVLKILGNSNVQNNKVDQPYRYYFNKNEYIIIDFDDNNKICLFFIIFKVED